jgi:hypothetical protein
VVTWTSGADPFRLKKSNLLFMSACDMRHTPVSCTQTLLAWRGQCPPHTGDFAPRPAHSEKKVGGCTTTTDYQRGLQLQNFLLRSKKRYTAYPRPDYLSQFCAFENHLNGDHLNEGNNRWSSLGQQFPGRINLRTQSGHRKTLFPDTVAGQRGYVHDLFLLPTPIIFLSSTCFVERG